MVVDGCGTIFIQIRGQRNEGSAGWWKVFVSIKLGARGKFNILEWPDSRHPTEGHFPKLQTSEEAKADKVGT